MPSVSMDHRVKPGGDGEEVSAVMPGLVPGIHVFLWGKDVDGRDKPGHDEEELLNSLHPFAFPIIARMYATAAGPLSALVHRSRAIFSCSASASGADVIIAMPTRMFGSSPRRNGLSARICRSG